ncbi:MAG: efflux RND transporter periplasmic adaptor subunit, partial [Planctomycetes bacterium]|nr:efflux RND transporter periplasmic adaptor subunit [Planctomycetota bacterium]
KLNVLDQYTSRKRKRELEENVAETRRELERVKARSEAALAQKKGEVSNREAQFELEKKKQEKLEYMLERNIVYAERDGVVLYGREGRGRDSKPIEPGTTLREGQTVVMLPDMERVLVDVDVHESSVHMVSLGMPVIVTTDTGETMQGVIESVATLADSQSWYRNPDLKVYSTKVTIENRDQKLKPGMNCSAEIIVKQLEDVLALPVQCVRSNGLKSYCWVKRDGKAVLTEIETGLHNHEMVNVTSGIQDGDEVFLAKPADAEDMPLPATGASRKLPKIEVKAQPAAPPADAAPEAGEGGGRGGRGRPDAATMERFKNMTDEEKKAFRDKMREGRGEGGGGPGGRGRRTGAEND